MSWISSICFVICAALTCCNGNEAVLKAQLLFTKQQYQLGDTLLAVVTVVNNSTDTVVLFPTLHQVKFLKPSETIIKHGKEKLIYRSGSSVDIGEEDPYKLLAPSEKISDTLVFVGMHIDGRKYVENPFLSRGKYEIMLILRYVRYFPEYPPNQFVGDIVAPWVSIEVK